MRRRLLIPALLTIVGLLGAGLAQAELAQDGNVRISFTATSARARCRATALAPVTIDVQGAIGTTDGTHPPAVRKIEIEINRHGRLSTQGLPACSGPLLQSTSTETALSRCRPALVGRGQFGANVEFPNADTGPRHRQDARLLRPQQRQEGAPPPPLRDDPGASDLRPAADDLQQEGNDLFGTVLSAKIPTLAGGLGSVTQIDLTIGRNYTYRGQRRSFISASCPAPAGFPGAIFSLARGSFYFADGKKIETTLARDCRVR